MKLTREDFDRLEEIQEAINGVISRVVRIYVTHGTTNIHKNDYSCSLDYYGEKEVNVKIEESWAYGGYDCNHFSFPIEYLFDESLVDQYEKDMIQKSDELIKRNIRAKKLAEKIEIDKAKNLLKQAGITKL